MHIPFVTLLSYCYLSVKFSTSDHISDNDFLVVIRNLLISEWSKFGYFVASVLLENKTDFSAINLLLFYITYCIYHKLVKLDIIYRKYYKDTAWYAWYYTAEEHCIKNVIAIYVPLIIFPNHYLVVCAIEIIQVFHSIISAYYSPKWI